jgi:hypothetical protein
MPTAAESAGMPTEADSAEAIEHTSNSAANEKSNETSNGVSDENTGGGAAAILCMKEMPVADVGIHGLSLLDPGTCFLILSPTLQPSFHQKQDRADNQSKVADAGTAVL